MELDPNLRNFVNNAAIPRLNLLNLFFLSKYNVRITGSVKHNWITR